MEEEKKESKRESAAEKSDKVNKKINKKFFLLIPVFIALCIGLFIMLRETGVINKYVYEEVDNLAEREGVCFDNLLFSYRIVLYREEQREEKWLCIMNTGEVFAFEWNNRLTPWCWYYEGDEKMNNNELHSRGYDETNWEKMDQVVYLGRFSDSAISRLIEYVDNFDINSKYYFLNPPQDTVPQGGDSQPKTEDMDIEGKEIQWRAYGVWLYWRRPSGEHFSDIEWSLMKPTWWGGYEKEVQGRSLDENAIAAIELFESSGFYDRWVKICLEGY